MMEGAPVAEGARGAPVGAPHPAVEISPRARFEVLGAILLALLLGALDQTIVGTALSGLSGEMWQLILFRGIQGIGAGSLFPISLAVIGDLFTPAERGKYQGLFGAVFGLSALVGPALGGIITDNVGWHWIFYINLPIGLISLLVVSRVLPSVKRPKHSLDLDLVGALVFVAAMIPLLVGLTNKQSADLSLIH